MTNRSGHPQPDLLSPEQAAFLAQIFAGLADPTRLRIIFALTQGEQTVGDLAEIAGVSQSAVSHHLARLRDQRLVHSHRDGNRVYYMIDDVHVAEMIEDALCHLDHVQRSLPNRAVAAVNSFEVEE